MKTKQRKRLQQRIVLCALAMAAGAVLGYWLGWHAGVRYAPPIILSKHAAPIITTTALRL